MLRARAAQLVSVALAVTGCRYGFDAEPAAGPFATPRVIPALSDPAASDDDPTVTGDLLELYFESDRFDAGDIFVSRRTSPDEPWPVPAVVAELSSPSDDETPEVTADGLTLFLSSDRPGGAGSYDLYVATRPSRDAAWSPPVRIAELATALTEAAAAPTADELDLAFHAEPAVGEKLDLYECTRATTDATWDTPHRIAELDTPSQDVTPFLTDGGLTIYFSSDRGGRSEIYRATRPARDAPFGAPELLPELSSSGNVEDPWLSADGHYLVIADDRSGTYDIYETSR